MWVHTLSKRFKMQIDKSPKIDCRFELFDMVKIKVELLYLFSYVLRDIC